MPTRIIIAVALLLSEAGYCGALAQEHPAPHAEINTVLMQSTFLIYGPKAGAEKDQISFGTVFLMGKPIPDDQSREYYVLISAAHVFNEITGDTATIILREKHEDGSYTPRPWAVKLRDNSAPLFVRHKDADVDVAALYVDMPDDLSIPILPTGLLATDDVLQKFEIHPGDELLCLGFPLFLSSESNFPILRSGKIASYPVVPTSTYKQMYFDFRVFEGNSGGPVYFADHDRIYGGSAHLGETEQFVVGLVTSQLGSKPYNGQLVELASVVPANYIRQTIELLPATSPYK
jgi:hypothetical protein